MHKEQQFSQEDLHDHRTVALAARLRGPANVRPLEDKWLFSINLKHRMVTFPIGKCGPNEGLVDGLIREMYEELGVTIHTSDISENDYYCNFTNIYDFGGVPVRISTYVYMLACGPGICKTAINREPHKCGGLFLATFQEASHMAKSLGLKLADCVIATYNKLKDEDTPALA